MSDTPKKLVKGERLKGIDTASHNAFYDTWKRVNESQRVAGGTGQSSGTATLAMEVFNASGADIDAAFPVLKITAPTYTTDDRPEVVNDGVSLEGDTPDAGTGINDICIVQGPIIDGESRSAVVVGMSWVKVEFTDESHIAAIPLDGDDTKLTSASSGIKIVWHEEIPDAEYLPADLWCLVFLGGSDSNNKTTFAVTVDPLPAGSETGTGTSYVRTLGTAGDVYVLVRDGGTLKVPEDAEPIEAVSGYKDRDIPANMLVKLDYAGSPPVATLVEVMDYLRLAEGYDAEETQVFYHDEDVLHAGGESCEEE